MHIWINFDPSDPIGQKFLEIKKFLGVNSRAEVIRHVVNAYPLERKLKEGRDD